MPPKKARRRSVHAGSQLPSGARTASLQDLVGEDVDSVASSPKALGFVRWADSELEESVPDSESHSESHPQRAIFPPEYYAKLRKTLAQMQGKSLRSDETYGYAECLRREHLLHGKYAASGLDDSRRHALAVAHIEAAQQAFLLSMQERQAALGAAASVSPRPAFYRHSRVAKDAQQIERLQAHVAAVVDIQNETRRGMMARELAAFEAT